MPEIGAHTGAVRNSGISLGDPRMSKATTRTKSSNINRQESVVDEVRRIRAAISRQFGNDVRKLCDHLQATEIANRHRLVYPKDLRSGRKAR